MRRTTWRLAGLWAAGLAVGCSSGGQRHPYADNPLLLSREPMVQKSQAVTSRPGNATLASQDPAQRPATPRIGPPNPPPLKGPAAVAATPLPDGPSLDQPASPPVIPVSRPASPPDPVFVSSPTPAHLPSPPTPASDPAPPAPLPSGLSKARFDRAADYAWIQGELDLHYRGHKELRYCPASEEDAHGGKVRLVDDPRLAEYQPGDIIRVEGELVRDEAPGGQYPRFHVRSVRLVERKTPKN
jgi:hypothetical protein